MLFVVFRLAHLSGNEGTSGLIRITRFLDVLGGPVEIAKEVRAGLGLLDLTVVHVSREAAAEKAQRSGTLKRAYSRIPETVVDFFFSCRILQQGADTLGFFFGVGRNDFLEGLRQHLLHDANAKALDAGSGRVAGRDRSEALDVLRRILCHHASQERRGCLAQDQSTNSFNRAVDHANLICQVTSN